MENLIEQEQLQINMTEDSVVENSLQNSLFKASLLLDRYYTPFLCLLGSLGNTLSLSVFIIDAKYRSQSSSYYLSALAVSDTIFLLSTFSVWLEGIHGGIITSRITCPLVMYTGQVTCFMSVYFTVAFSIERYVAVHYPFSRPRICTRSKAKKIIGCITALALVLFSYVCVIADVVALPGGSEDTVTEPPGLSESWEFSMVPHPRPEYPDPQKETEHKPVLLETSTPPPPPQQHQKICTVPNKYYRISEAANYADSIVTLILPFFLILFFNTRIATTVWKLKDQRSNIVATRPNKSKTRRPLLNNGTPPSNSIEMSNVEATTTGTQCSPRSVITRKPTPSSEVRVTKTLLLVSLTFVVLNLPAHGIRCAQFIQSIRGTSESSHLLHTLQPWANILFNTNFAVNFLLYCVSGRNFRNCLKSLVKRNCSYKHCKKHQSTRLASWASDKTRKRQNSTATASTALGLPSMGSLAVGDENARLCRRKRNEGMKDEEDRWENTDEEDEQSTSLYVAEFSHKRKPHETYVNYCGDEIEDESEHDIEQV